MSLKKKHPVEVSRALPTVCKGNKKKTTSGCSESVCCQRQLGCDILYCRGFISKSTEGGISIWTKAWVEGRLICHITYYKDYLSSEVKKVVFGQSSSINIISFLNLHYISSYWIISTDAFRVFSLFYILFGYFILQFL